MSPSRWICLAVISQLLFPFSAWAGLGDKGAAVDKTRQALSGRMRAERTKSSYSTREWTSGLTTVREYLNADGTVFAVTWKGPKRPDLSVLLGSYSSEYNDASKSRESSSRGRKETVVRTTNIVVRRGGHMRALHGRAYVPNLAPADTDPETLP